jgi:hypothetical protein
LLSFDGSIAEPMRRPIGAASARSESRGGLECDASSVPAAATALAAKAVTTVADAATT